MNPVTSFFNLPLDVLHMLTIEYLSNKDVRNLCLTSSYFNKKLGHNVQFWKHKYRFDISTIIVPQLDSEYRPHYIQMITALNQLSTINQRLLFAAESGCEKLVQTLIKAGADINFSEYDGGYALSVASYKGHLHIIKYIMEILGTDGNKNHALRWAIGGNQLSVVKYLVDSGAVYILLMMIILIHSRIFECGHFNIIKYLLDCVTTIDQIDSHIIITAATNGHLEVIQYLLSLDQRYQSYFFKVARFGGRNIDYALIAAAKYGHLSIVQYLLSLDQDRRVNIHFKNDDTFFWAVYNGHLEVVAIRSC